MARLCPICGSIGPHHSSQRRAWLKRRICRQCRKLPEGARREILERDEIVAFLHQSHISIRNKKRLRELRNSDLPKVAEMADRVQQIAAVAPHARRRFKVLARSRRDLLAWLAEVTGRTLYDPDEREPDWDGPFPEDAPPAAASGSDGETGFESQFEGDGSRPSPSAVDEEFTGPIPF